MMIDRAMPAVSRGERALVAVTLCLAIGVLPLAGGGVLWTRPLWLDEICCTLYPVMSASSPVDVVRNVAHRGDFAPPGLHLMVWSVGKVTGGLTPVVLRSVSLVCVALALALLYFTMRRRFERAPSAAAVIAVASHALVLTHAFEARFYGPWLLFAVGFAWSLPRSRTLTAVFSVLLVAIHWFGVLSLGLLAIGAVASQWPRWRAGLKVVWPSAAGLAVLAALIPMALGHRASAVGLGALWVPELSAGQVMVVLRLFFWTTAPVVAATLLLVAAVRARKETIDAVSNAMGEPGIAALMAAALFPAVLLGVSVLLQPSMLDRYAIVTVLAWAPLVALAVSTLGRTLRVVAVAGALVLLGIGVRNSINDRRETANNIAETRAAFDQATALHLPIVFPSILALYPIGGPSKDQTVLFLDLPDSTISALVPQPRLAWMRRNLTVERNIARGHRGVYGFPAIATQAGLDTTPRFLLVASDESLPRLYPRVDLFAKAVFPRHHVTRLSPTLALLER